MSVSSLRYTGAVTMLAMAIACGRSQTPATSSESAAAPSVVKLDGSSTVFPISEAVAEEFQKTHPAIKVTVGISGTGGGFQKFCRGEIDISDASRPISQTELDACDKAGIKFVELPVAYDGIAIVANPKATWISDISTEELKKIWAPEGQGKITRWNQVRASWPNRELHLFGPGVDSGTFDYFTEAIVGKAKASRGDFTSSEDDNVLVQGVAGDEGALGYFGFAYYDENKSRLKLIPVDDKKPDNGNGPIAPSFETIRNGTYQPLSRPLFVYPAEKALARPEVQQFVDYYLANVAKLAEEVGYVQLGPQVYQLVTEHFKQRKTGSVFGGGAPQVGVTIEQLLQKERAQ